MKKQKTPSIEYKEQFQKLKSELTQKSGIYKISFVNSNKIYIGSAVNLFNRCFYKHYIPLIENYHGNKKLQNYWDKLDGKNNSKFEVLEFCEKEKLIEREQFYLNTLLFAKEYLNSKFEDRRFEELGLNNAPIAESSLGFKHGRESLEQISNSISALWQKEEYRDKFTEMHSNEEYQKFRGECISKSFDENSSREKISEALKKFYENNPEAKRNIKDIMNSQEYHDLISKKIKDKWNEEEYRNKHIETRKEGSEFRKNVSNGIKEKWKDENYRKVLTQKLSDKDMIAKRNIKTKETKSKEDYENSWFRGIIFTDSISGEVTRFKSIKDADEKMKIKWNKNNVAIVYYILNNHKNYLGGKWEYEDANRKSRK